LDGDVGREVMPGEKSTARKPSSLKLGSSVPPGSKRATNARPPNPRTAPDTTIFASSWNRTAVSHS
jgi:hypothetical protein